MVSASQKIKYTVKKIQKEIELYRKYQKQNKNYPLEVYYYEIKIHELSKVRTWLDEKYENYQELKQTTLFT